MSAVINDPVELTTTAVAQPIVAMPPTPMALLQIAMEQNADIDKLTKLLDLQERWEANNARKAFVVAMAAFKADPPTITKNKHVSYANKTGGRTEYDHATHDEVCDKIAAALSPHGLSHRWETVQAEGRIIVTCIITHVAGHSERTTLSGTADDSGGKNSIQAIGSAVTYLQRYTLLGATGLSSKEVNVDDDGRAAAASAEKISVDQATALRDLLSETNSTEAAFLELVNAERIEDIPAAAYAMCKGILEAKRNRVRP